MSDIFPANELVQNISKSKEKKNINIGLFEVVNINNPSLVPYLRDRELIEKFEDNVTVADHLDFQLKNFSLLEVLFRVSNSMRPSYMDWILTTPIIDSFNTYGGGSYLNPEDTDHGSHTSGIITANSNNVEITPINWTDGKGFKGKGYNDFFAGVVKARNLRLLNFSYDINWIADDVAFLAKENPQSLFLIAAGNDGKELDYNEYSPLSELPNVLIVGSVNSSNSLSSFSNFSKKVVHVSAIGTEVVSFDRLGKEIKMSGTSMATPFVLTAATKMLEANPYLSPLRMKQILINSSDKVSSLQDRFVSGGVINVERATQLAKSELKQSIKSYSPQIHVLKASKKATQRVIVGACDPAIGSSKIEILSKDKNSVLQANCDNQNLFHSSIDEGFSNEISLRQADKDGNYFEQSFDLNEKMLLERMIEDLPNQ